jgi:hypothetical protein
MGGPGALTAAPSADVRRSIRALLTSAEGFAHLGSSERTELAHALVKIAATALHLERDVEDTAPPPSPPLARGMDAGQRFSGVAADKVADTTKRILNAVSFPRFVNDLLIGVFKALVDTNQQQMQAYVDLIKAVASTTEGFADANVGLDGARRWLADRFPANFAVESLLEPGDTPEEGEPTVELRLRPGAAMPSEAALRAGLGMGPEDSVPSGSPESLLPLVRSTMARNRQQMLATMVMLGMQRIVIDSGRINASMRFHIDTRSAAEEQGGSTFDTHHEIAGSASYGVGPWGFSASMRSSIGYVSTQAAQSTEEMNTDLDLNSSVELVFKTDYVPLDRLATGAEVSRIKVNTLNPEAEAKLASEERRARTDSQRAREADARQQMSATLKPPPAAPPLQPPPLPSSGKASAPTATKKEVAGAPASDQKPAAPRKSGTAPAPVVKGKAATGQPRS